ncbi:MAG: bifunctional phosphopantothenoylcysteine decarboxylase/phosphopantothenate--cysteine ligase CoaBC [Flavobacteriales bacterium]|nr:bifunctional phosphopantothenoylcysteine decarboxylase/phosphopantothenate--cysteine ligase CoaBC [Flavobacteriales bacterium]
MLRGKKVLIGVTGSIAAYKVATLIRFLVRKKAFVKVIMTEDAKEFITPLTLATLSKNPVHYLFTDDKESGEWNNHIDLGLWADVFIIAPATANTLFKIANGHCDNLLMATYLSAKCPVYIAPAMDLDMYKHSSTKENIDKIVEFGNRLINPEHGELASGLVGEGRMAEPEQIVEVLETHFESNVPLKGKKILISAGPTHEAIDPVRFIGNHSSGKMGFAIAEEAAVLGAEVELICGPTSITLDIAGVTVVNVTSAQEMYDACVKRYATADVAIMAAAVADYRPKNVADKKIKKENQTNELVIELEKTPDILKSLGEQKHHQLLVGFALETDNEEANAKLKMEKKNLDFIILNSLRDKGAGFSTDTNRITILDKHNNILNFELKSKQKVALDILHKVIEELNA